jgi:MoxR-like ATPase
LSLFDRRSAIWTPEVAGGLKRRFVESFDSSARSFAAKLSDQLRGASQEVYLLTAELMYIHLLPLSNVGLDRKLGNINAVGAEAPEPFTVPSDLTIALGLGPANGGAGFSTNRFYLMSLLIEFAVVWSELPEPDRVALLGDPWAFKALLAGLPQERAAAQRNALLFMLYPETFEDIVATEHKRKIAAAFADVSGDSSDLDRQILAIRTAKSDEFGREFNWYAPDIRSIWYGPTADLASERPGGSSVADDLEAMLPGQQEREVVASAFADAIEIAHAANPRSWSVTRRHGGVSLNVANNRVLSVFPTEPSGLAIPVEDVAALEAPMSSPTTYATPGEVAYVVVERSALARALTTAGEAFRRAVAACTGRNTPFLGAFSEEAVQAIESIAGRALPRPKAGSAVDRTAQAAWIVRMKQDGKSHVQGALARGDVRIFWALDVPAGSSFEAIKSAVVERDPELGTHSAGNQAGSVFRFITRMKPGDLVLLPDGSDLFIGTVDGDAHFDTEAQAWVRPVVWSNIDAPVERSEVSPALYSRLRSLLTITDISELVGELGSYISVTDSSDEGVISSLPEVALATIDEEVAEGWLLDREWLQEIVDLLSVKKQVIFFGPPGTGKTFLAQKLAEHLTADGGSFKIVQFHPSYAYEDFVEGFRPKVNADGSMVYELKPGPLREIAEAATANPTEPYFLIIDEINRGNLAKIFGELYFLLEYREQGLLLQYGSGGDSEFRLPKNLFVIGTMNTADRSIAIVDAAVRRRFYFVEFSPNEEPIGGMLDRWLSRNRLDRRPAELLRELNRLIGDRDYAIGPSYLMSDRIDQDRELERVWRFGILPLLNELYYGEPNIEARLGLKAVQRSLSQRSPSASQASETSDDVVADGQE